MARTILEIATEAAERRATCPPPPTLFGTNDRTARILRNAAHDVMREILRRSKYQGLSEFHSQWAFATVPGEFAYSLPPDFLRMIPNTEHRGGWPMSLLGPASPQMWSIWINGLGSGTTAEMSWRVRNNALFIEPTPAAEEILTIEYVSHWYVTRDVDQNTEVDWNATPAMLRPPLVSRDGYVAAHVVDVTEADLARYEEEGYGDQWAEHFYDRYKRVDPETTDPNLPRAQIRTERFEADTDRCALADDHILSLGMTAKLRQALALPYAEDLAEFEEEMHAKIIDDAGGVREFRPGGTPSLPDAYPLGSGKWMVG